MYISKAHETFEMMQVISDPSFEYNFTRASYSPVWNYFWNNMPRIRTKTFLLLLILQKNNWLTRANQVRDDVWNRLNWTQFQRAWSWSSTFNMLMIESNHHISSKRYYHLKIEIKISIESPTHIKPSFFWPNNIWSQKAFTSSTIKRLKTSINSWKKRKLASLERKFIKNSGSLALIVDFMELWQSWDSDHLPCWKDGR